MYFTSLQISLELSKYSVSCTYDEIKRFKQSAAVDKQFKGTVLNSKNGLIKYVSDNLDAQICSHNSIKQTHGLASVGTQPISEETY